MSKRKLFISHISTEQDLAVFLKTHLAKDFLNALDVFVSSDRTSLRPGDKWLDALSQALLECQIEFILCSTESVGRPWVNFEAGAGWIRDIQIIPVCHSGMRPDQLPLPLNLLQSVEASRPEGLRQLYESVACVLDMATPTADFEAMANEVKQLESKFLRMGSGVTTIDNPRILCAASAYYSQSGSIGFDQDVAVLEEAFPKRITVERELTSDSLRNLLARQPFDILHLVLPVHPDTGALIFSQIDSTYRPDSPSVDTMPSKAFAEWLGESKTSLVVLATCHALPLAVDVAPVANIIAHNSVITEQDIKVWGKCFYGMLANGLPLFKAFDMTKSNYPHIMMRLVRHKEVAFAR
jgi:hypothetical protein